MSPRTLGLLALVGSAAALQAGPRPTRFAAKSAFTRVVETGAQTALAAIFAAAIATPDAAKALSKDTYNSLTYDQIKGTGLANKCPDATTASGNINLGGKLSKFDELCMEPKEFFILETSTDKKGNAKTEMIPGKVRASERAGAGLCRGLTRGQARGGGLVGCEHGRAWPRGA
jgi:hypothetical protein